MPQPSVHQITPFDKNQLENSTVLATAIFRKFSYSGTELECCYEVNVSFLFCDICNVSRSSESSLETACYTTKQCCVKQIHSNESNSELSRGYFSAVDETDNNVKLHLSTPSSHIGEPR
jgi:hypothetical protein